MYSVLFCKENNEKDAYKIVIVILPDRRITSAPVYFSALMILQSGTRLLMRKSLKDFPRDDGGGF